MSGVILHIKLFSKYLMSMPLTNLKILHCLRHQKVTQIFIYFANSILLFSRFTLSKSSILYTSHFQCEYGGLVNQHRFPFYQFFVNTVTQAQYSTQIKLSSQDVFGRGKLLGHTAGDQRKLRLIFPQSTAFTLTQEDDLGNLPCVIAFHTRLQCENSYCFIRGALL